jgi:hypothetical protein
MGYSELVGATLSTPLENAVTSQNNQSKYRIILLRRVYEKWRLGRGLIIFNVFM